MAKVSGKEAYERVSELVSLDEANGLPKERSVLLLWFLRNSVGLEELDAYDFICDGDRDNAVDGLYLEGKQGDDQTETLVIYQSYFTESAKRVGRKKLESLISCVSHFRTEGALQALLDSNPEPPLRRLIEKFDLVEKLKSGALADGRLKVRLVLVTTGTLNKEARRLVESQNSEHGVNYLAIQDLPKLWRLAKAVSSAESGIKGITIPAERDERIITKTHDNGNRVGMFPVRASDIVEWDGLDTRELFDLNVRGELRKNRVRDQLDGAIRRTEDHKDFLASHNGLTVTCERFDDSDDHEIIVHQPSVVNGVQSSMAFVRADDEGKLTDELRVFVKVVEASNRPHFASSVSARSNTQNAVNPRNLVANSGPQKRLISEFEKDFPGIHYETKPSVGNPSGDSVIANDEAAQLLCTVYLEEPWLAVKRTSLFKPEDYPRIFNENVTAAHVVLVNELQRSVQDVQDRVPEPYVKSWKLTRLVLVYLVSQVMRSSPEMAALLDDPASALDDRDALREKIKPAVSAAVLTLKKRKDKRERDNQDDDFRVEFKNRDELRSIRDQARDAYLTLIEAKALED